MGFQGLQVVHASEWRGGFVIDPMGMASRMRYCVQTVLLQTLHGLPCPAGQSPDQILSDQSPS